MLHLYSVFKLSCLQSGHSTSAATAQPSLWLSYKQGGPIPGNSEFRTLFQAAVGRAYKCVTCGGTEGGLQQCRRLMPPPQPLLHPRLSCLRVI